MLFPTLPLLVAILTGGNVLAQERGVTPIWHVIDAQILHPHPSADKRLGQPYWKATLLTPGLQNRTGEATFIDNGYEENELNWSESVGGESGLMDALWTIKKEATSETLVIYSDGKVIKTEGNLESGCFTLTYEREGQTKRLIIERIVN